jgi:exodeoxyribonuclease V alpha subunit
VRPDEAGVVTGELIFVSPLKPSGWGWGKVRTGKGRKAKRGSRADEVRISGDLRGYLKGAFIEAHGEWNHHPTYGPQLRVVSIMSAPPESPDATVAWLQLHLPQIGTVRARQLVDRFGALLWETLANDPAALEEIPGLTADRVAELQRAYWMYAENRALYVKLYGFGYTQKEVDALAKTVPAKKIESIARTPHRLCLLNLISFGRAEALGVGLGVSLTDPSRLQAGVLDHLENVETSTGSTLFAVEDVVRYAASHMHVTDVQAVEQAVAALCDTEALLVRVGADHVAEVDTHRAEQDIADRVVSLIDASAWRVGHAYD